MRRLKRTIPLLVCIGLIGLLLAGIVHASHSSASPLDHAQAVARTDSWIPERGRRGEFPWIVSDLKGENRHEIAAYPLGTSMNGDQNPYSFPRWMPDGKHISFIYQSTLYIRPVD